MKKLTINFKILLVVLIFFSGIKIYARSGFEITITNSVFVPVNDLPCGAILIPLGGSVLDSNDLSGSFGEPADAAQCDSGGSINTVWFKVVVPASGQVSVRTNPLTISDTQIEGFTFPAGCSNSEFVFATRGCNNNGVGCSGGLITFSEQTFSGLIPGDTLYLAVDGVDSLTGTFEIFAIDSSAFTYPPVYIQDCEIPKQICSTSDVVVANPGFHNFGNVCDMPVGIGCFATGERNSSWYQFTVDPALSGFNATISFDIISDTTADFDFMMWDITNLNDVCTSIKNHALTDRKSVV